MPKTLDVDAALQLMPPARWPGALDRAGLAEFLSVSLRTVDKLSSSELPPDFRIGDSPRWLLSRVTAWCEGKAAK